MLFVDHIHSNSTFLLVPELSVAGAQETLRICTMPFRLLLCQVNWYFFSSFCSFLQGDVALCFSFNGTTGLVTHILFRLLLAFVDKQREMLWRSRLN